MEKGRGVVVTIFRKGRVAVNGQKATPSTDERALVMKALDLGRSAILGRVMTNDGAVAAAVITNAGLLAGRDEGLSGAVQHGRTCRCCGCRMA